MKKEKEHEIKEETPVENEEVRAEETEEPVDEVEELKKQLAEKDGQIAILKNEYAKAYADTENTRKRLRNEFDMRNKYRIQDFALQVLPVLDDCERAMAVETTDENYKKGVEMIYGKLKHALESEGVTEIEALDQPFDANWHQALMSEKKEDTEPGIVIQVLQKGYKLKDRLLRAAMVKISE
jgi:molecular chaperone GrpE